MYAVHAPTQSLLLNATDPLTLRELLPKSKLLQHDQFNFAVKHTLASTKLLRNVGYNVPAPIQSQYRWPGKYKPFDHQREMAAFLTMNKRAFNLSEMGVGKSAATLWAADWLMEQGLVQKCLILSPLSTLERVWKSDIFDVLMHRSAIVVHGSRDKRKEALDRDVDFYIMNHDGVAIKEIADIIARRPDIGLVVVDEASMFRNHATQKYKSLSAMVRPDQRLWLLTGTPCPNAPTDAWALAKLVSPDRVPKFFGSFRRAVMMQISQYKWIARTDAYETAYEAMQPAIRFKKADCLDLPPVVTMDRGAKMSKAQIKAMADMRSDMQAEMNNGVKITAVNAADKINKMRQILCGVVKDPKTENYVEIDHKPRTEVLLEAIENASAKVLVVVPFKGIIRSLETELQKAGHTVGVLNGDVSPRLRDKIVLDFKTQPDPHVLLCHPKVMAHGLNLTEADTLVFYAPIYSNDEFQQVVERFNRTGQTRKMTIVRIGAHPVDWAIYKMVDSRKITQDNILELYQLGASGATQ